jgi:esterase/lipase superfamily enzyme
MDECAMVRKLPVEPFVPELDTLPVNVLLALGKGATRGDHQSIFNLPATAAALLGDWSRVRTVLNLRIWAPEWDADRFRSYLGEAGRNASSRDLPDDTWRESTFLGLPDVDGGEEEETAQYEIVHCISDIGQNFDGDPFLFLGVGRHQILAAGTLRDALVRSGTRLLILHSLGSHIERDSAERLAELVVAAGGPTVLIVAEEGGRNLDAYFLNLYARILCNQPLEEAAAAPEGGPSTLLVHGTGGDRFDGLMERLEKRLADYSGLVKGLLEGIRDIERGRLQVTHGPTADELRSLHELDSRIDTELTRLGHARTGVGAHAAEGPSLLSAVVANVSSITMDIGLMPGEGHLHTMLFDPLKYELQQARYQRGLADERPGRSHTMALDARWVSLLFATTRQRREDDFSGERSDGTISFGRTHVRIPEDHAIGKVERPLEFTLFSYTIFRQEHDPTRHFTAGVVNIIPESEWISHIRSFGAADCLLFIHGFSTSFGDAILRFAQIVWDLKFDGLPILFSWPSRGTIHDYLYDRDSAMGATPQLIEVAQKISSQENVRRIHILAHSMGNFCLLDGLANHLDALNALRIGELIMAAPDIDRDLYRQRTAVIRPRTRGMTLYASAADRALALSKKVAGDIPRAGDVFDGTPILVDGVDAIDVTFVGEEMFGFGHGTYSETRSVLNDVKILLTGKRPPHDRLIDIEPVPDKNNPKFWRYLR